MQFGFLAIKTAGHNIQTNTPLSPQLDVKMLALECPENLFFTPFNACRRNYIALACMTVIVHKK